MARGWMCPCQSPVSENADGWRDVEEKAKEEKECGDGEMTMMKHGCATPPHLRQLFSDGG